MSTLSTGQMSDTDVRVFSGLINPQKARLDDLQYDYERGTVGQAATSFGNTNREDENEGSDSSHLSPPKESPLASPPESPVESRIESRACSRAESQDESQDEAVPSAGANEDMTPAAIDDDLDNDRPRARSVRSDRSDSPPPASEASDCSHHKENASRIGSQLGSRVSSHKGHSNPLYGGIDRHLHTPQAKRASSVSDSGSRVSDFRSVADEARRDTDAAPQAQPFNQYFKQQRSKTTPGSASGRIRGVPRQSSALIMEKQNVLMDIERLKLQGIEFSKTWTLEDRLEDMQYEMRRHMLHLEEVNNMNMMRDGMRMICTGVEMVNGRMKLLELNGWAAEVCGDMSKYDPALSRLYRKYWRRSQSASPEMEIAMGMLTSMGMYHFKRKVSSRMFSGGLNGGFGGLGGQPADAPFSHRPAPTKRSSSPVPSDSGSEGLPPPN